jgi:prepilin-type N-terminal cleavage/methylation domain-containing protein
MRTAAGWVRRRLAPLRSSEGGMTLVEILCAVAILGIVIPGIIAGLGTVSLASDYHRKQATADTVVKSYAENLKSRVQSVAYRSCVPDSASATATNQTYEVPTTLWAPPTGYSVSIKTVEFWHSTAPAANPFNTTCTPDEGAQRLTLKAVSGDGRDTEELQIIVRKP